MVLESGQNPLNQYGHQASSSGIGNMTPQTHSQEDESMPFGESDGQRHPQLNKIPSFKKPEYFFGRESNVSPIQGMQPASPDAWGERIAIESLNGLTYQGSNLKQADGLRTPVKKPRMMSSQSLEALGQLNA